MLPILELKTKTSVQQEKVTNCEARDSFYLLPRQGCPNCLECTVNGWVCVCLPSFDPVWEADARKLEPIFVLQQRAVTFSHISLRHHKIDSPHTVEKTSAVRLILWPLLDAPISSYEAKELSTLSTTCCQTSRAFAYVTDVGTKLPPWITKWHFTSPQAGV